MEKKVNSNNSSSSHINDHKKGPRLRKESSHFNRINSQKNIDLDSEKESNFFLKITDELLKELHDEASFKNLINVNRMMREFGTRLKTDSSALLVKKTLERKIEKIKSNQFHWEVDFRKFKLITPLFSVTDAFDHWAEFTYVDPQPIIADLLSYRNLRHLFGMDYYLGHDDMSLDHVIQDVHCTLTWTFLKLYVNFPCANYPVVDDQSIELGDPLSRHKIRKLNQSNYTSDTQLRQNFDLTEEIDKLVSMFVLQQPLKWNSVPNRNSVLPLLHLIHQSLTFGLISDCELIMVKLEHTTEILIHLEHILRAENRQKTNELNVQTDDNTNREESYHELFECRVVVSRILLHVICLYNDTHFHGLMLSSRTGQLNGVGSLKDGLWENQQLLRHISLVYLNYLCNQTFQTFTERLSRELQRNNHSLMVYLVNHKDNFFVNSLAHIHSDCLSLYLNPLTSLHPLTTKIIQSSAYFISLIRQRSESTSLSMLVSSLLNTCSVVANAFESKSDYYGQTTAKRDISWTSVRPIQLELGWTGFTLFFLRNFVKLQTETKDESLLHEGVRVLILLMRDNRLAQSTLFGGSGLKAFSDLMGRHCSLAFHLLKESFRCDWSLFHKSKVLFDLIVKRFDGLLSKFNDVLANRPNGSYPASLMSSIVNCCVFLISLLKSPNSFRLGNSTNYDIVIQNRLVPFVTNHLFSMLGDKGWKEYWRNAVLITPSSIDTSTESSSHSLNSFSKVQILRTLFCLLELFNQSSCRVYTRLTSAQVVNCLKSFELSKIPTDGRYSLGLKREVLLLFSHYAIFPNNHMMFDELSSPPTVDLYRQFIPISLGVRIRENWDSISIEKIDSFIHGELNWISTAGQLNVEIQNDTQYDLLIRYLFGALLPSIAKFFKALESTLTILEDEETINTLKQFSSKTSRSLKAKWSVFDDIENERPTASRPPQARTEMLGYKVPSAFDIQEKAEDQGEGDNSHRLSNRFVPTEERLPVESDSIGEPGKGRESGVRRSTRELALEEEGRRESERNLMKKISMKKRSKSRSDWTLREKMGSNPSNRRRAVKISLDQLMSQLEEEIGDEKRPSVDRSATARPSLSSVTKSFINSETHFQMSNLVERKEELSNEAFVEIRRDTQDVLNLIADLYKQRPEQSVHLSPLKRIPLVDQEDLLWEETTENEPSQSPLLTDVIRLHRASKYDTRPDQNPFLRLLTTDVHRERYNFELAHLSINLLSNTCCEVDFRDYHKSLFTQQFYFKHIESLTALLTHSPLLVVQMYELLALSLSDKNKHVSPNFRNIPVTKAFFQNLWSISVSLTLFLFYKPFEDEVYSRCYRLNKLLSFLFKGFFGHNFPKLREMMSLQDFGIFSTEFSSLKRLDNLTGFNRKHMERVSRNISAKLIQSNRQRTSAPMNIAKKIVHFAQFKQTHSIFFESFLLALFLFNQTNVWRHSDGELMPSDRPPLFFVLVEVLNDVTSFVGQSIENQLKVYHIGNKVWSNIINRVVTDIDSDFYKVKLAVLTYVNGLLLGLNEDIIDSLSHQLRVQVLHETMIELVRLLYQKMTREESDDAEGPQRLLNMEELMAENRRKLYQNYDPLDHFKSFQAAKNKSRVIHSKSKLLEMYRNDSRFNGHPIIGVVVAMFVLMKTLATKLKFWYMYIKEKDSVAQMSGSNERFRTEDNAILNFINDIISSVEVVYVVNESKIKKKNVSTAEVSLISINQQARDQSEKSQEENNSNGDMQSQNMSGNQSRDDSFDRTFKRKSSSLLHYEPRDFKMPIQSKKTKEAHSVRSNDTFNEVKKEFDIEGTRSKTVQQRFYFLTPPLLFFLTSDSKESLLKRMPVRSTTKRQICLYNNIFNLVQKIEKNSLRQSKVGSAYTLVTSDYFRKYEMVMALISFLMNVLMLVFLKNQNVTQNPKYNQQSDLEVLRIYGYVNIGFASLFWGMWIIFQWPTSAQSKIKRMQADKGIDPTRLQTLRVYLLDSLLLNNEFNTFLLYFVLSILGSTITFWFYNLALLLVVKVFDDMYDVLGALIRNFRSMISIVAIMFLLMYFFAIVIMMGLDDSISHELGGSRNCRTLFLCALNIMNSGLRESFGIGGFFYLITDPSKQRFWLMWFVNVTFSILVKVVGINLLSAAMINGFKNIRNERVMREFDRENNCLVCGMDKWESVKRGLSFDDHINKTHSVWDYFAFLVRLEKTKKTLLSGLEYEVFNQYELGRTLWFPKNNFLKDDEHQIEIKNEMLKSSPGDRDTRVSTNLSGTTD